VLSGVLGDGAGVLRVFLLAERILQVVETGLAWAFDANYRLRLAVGRARRRRYGARPSFRPGRARLFRVK